MVELVRPTCHTLVQFSLVSAPRQHVKSMSLSQPSGEGWFPKWLSCQESACQCRRHRRQGLSLWVGKSPWRRKWQSHGEMSLVGYSPWGHKRVSMTEQLSKCIHIRQGSGADCGVRVRTSTFWHLNPWLSCRGQTCQPACHQATFHTPQRAPNQSSREETWWKNRSPWFQYNAEKNHISGLVLYTLEWQPKVTKIWEELQNPRDRPR